MSVALTLIGRSKALGVSLLIVGDKLRVRSEERPPDDLIECLREHKVAVIAELQRRNGEDSQTGKQAIQGVGQRSSSSSSSSSKRGANDDLCLIHVDLYPIHDDPFPACAPKPEPPKQDLGREAIEALKSARQYRVWFHLEGDDVQIEYWPQMPAYPLARLKEASKGIAALLLSPLRPLGYSNKAWLQAVLDADRLGYPFR
jgi:hypothetical protein